MSNDEDFDNILKEMKTKPDGQQVMKQPIKKEEKKKEEVKKEEKGQGIEISIDSKPQAQVAVSKVETPVTENKVDVAIKPQLTQLPPAPKPQSVNKPKIFDVQEDTTVGKEVWTLFGHKGHGKTTAAMSFDGIKVILSFDRKATQIKQNMYDNDPKIKVYDCVKFMNYGNTTLITESADTSFDYIMAVLEKVKEYSPDWIVIDGTELMQQICEWKMRAANQVSAFEGFKNLNLWKERRAYVRQIHNKAYEVASKGIIYTTYIDKDEVVEKGEVIAKKDVPKWIDVILTETDYVLKVEHEFISGNFVVEVVNSKNDKKVKTGRKFVVSGKRFYEMLTESEKPEVKFTLGAAKI